METDTRRIRGLHTRSKLMKEVVELKVTVKKLAGVVRYNDRPGMVSPELVLLKTSDTVVTDRLIVTDEGVRVLDLRQ